MALINMDKIGANLMAAMGLSPDQVRGFVVTILQEVQDIKTDREAFRPASQRAYRDVIERLERMEGLTQRLAQHFGLQEDNENGRNTNPDASPDGHGPALNGHGPEASPGPASGA